MIIVALVLWCPHRAHGEMSLQPSLRIEERYDTNFFSEGSASNPEDTFVTTTTPSLRLSYTRQHFSFDVSYSHHFRYLTRTSETTDDGENRSSLALDLPLSVRTTFSVSDAFSFVEDSVTASDDAPGAGIQTERTERIANTFSLGLNHAFTPRTTARLTLTDSSVTFLDSSLIDSRRDSADLVTTHQLMDKTSINMSYGYSLFTFDNAGGEENTESHSLSFGISERVSPTFSLSLSGGASYTLGIEDDYNAIGQASLSKEFQQSSFSLGYSRGVADTSGLAAETSINDTFSVRWSYAASSSVNFGIYGAFSKNQSKATENVDTDSYSAGLDSKWRPYSWLTLGVGYSHLQQWADGTLGTDLSRDQASVTITATPAGWSL